MGDTVQDFPTLDSYTKRENIGCDPLLCKRYAAFAIRYSWPLLTVLSFSKIFRNAAFSLPPSCWSLLVSCIKDNAVSLEVFAKVRGVERSSSTMRIAKHLSPDLRLGWLDLQGKTSRNVVSSPCAYVVADRMDLVKQPVFEDFQQVDIRNCIYNPAIFASGKKPTCWPQGKPWPSDPTLREPGVGVCRSCGSVTMCHCDHNTADIVTHPPVELKDFGCRKGRPPRRVRWRHQAPGLQRRSGLLSGYHSVYVWGR